MFWFDVGKAFIGAFFGAGFAFATTMLVQWRQRRNDHIKAGNLALAVIREMFNAYLNIKRACLSTKEYVLKTTSSNAPVWLYFKPTTFPFAADLKFDVSTLAFLFDRAGVEGVQKLSLVEANYRSLCQLIESHRAAREQIQRRMAEIGIKSATTISTKEVEEQVGFDLIEKTNDLTRILLEHFEKDEDLYTDAFDFLRGELTRRYGNRFLKIEIKGKTMSEDELKKRQHLHERTRDEIAANTRSMAENLDRSLLALSSAFLGGSLAFINQVVKVETAAFKWLLYASWIFFAATIALTITSLILGVLQMRPLQVAAERYYIKGDASAWGVSDRLQRRTFLWVMACGVTFILGILSLAAFVLLNLV